MENSKSEIRSTKQIQIEEIQNPKHYDLEDRTLKFAKRTRALIQRLSRTIALIEDGQQVIRSSGSVGANYIEANESLSKKDFVMRIKICRKEAKESKYWLTLLIINDAELSQEQQELIQEATELTNIFGAILRKCK